MKRSDPTWPRPAVSGVAVERPVSWMLHASVALRLDAAALGRSGGRVIDRRALGRAAGPGEDRVQTGQ